jgi:1,4-dihydroxy-6-naphthoate synthase
MNSHNFRIGLSPCPNDTFICHALLHGLVDTEGIRFEACFDDVESLNHQAFHGEIDLTKVSFHAWLYLLNSFSLLGSGAALGRGCGPLLIAREPMDENRIPALELAVPGEFTTANLLLSLAYPTAANKNFMVFSAIEDAVLRGKCDAGVIIHENRFTYQQKGLICLRDLGNWWEERTSMPIPLGGFIVSKLLDPGLQQAIARIMHRSVRYAFDHPDASRDFVAKYAQEMDAEVRNAHISLYVNEYSLDLGETGRQAIEYLRHEALRSGLTIRGDISILSH